MNDFSTNRETHERQWLNSRNNAADRHLERGLRLYNHALKRAQAWGIPKTENPLDRMDPVIKAHRKKWYMVQVAMANNLLVKTIAESDLMRSGVVSIEELEELHG